MPSSVDTTPPARVRPGVTLGVLMLAGLAFALLQSLVSPALPTIQDEIGASQSGVTWVLTAYLLSAAVATPILGRLGDVYGKRRMLIVSLAGLGVGSLLAALGGSLWMLVVARLIQGLGGGVFPLAFGIIRDEFPARRVPGSIGALSSLLGLGGGLGVILAGPIIDAFGWHWLFWFPFIAVAIALFATIAFVPEGETRDRSSINWTGAALMSGGLSAVLLAVSQTGSWGWGSPKTLGLLAAGGLLIGLWIRSELRSSGPLVDMRLMARKPMWTTNLVAAMLGASMFTGFILIPQLVERPEAAGGFGATVTGAGFFLLPLALSMFLVGQGARRIEARFGSKPPVLAGVAFTLVGFLLLLTDHDDRLAVYLASGLLGIGMGLAFAALANLVVAASPPEHVGVATGMNTVTRTVGGALGGQLSGTFLAAHVTAAGVATTAGFQLAFGMAAGALLIALVVGAAIPSRRSAYDAPDLAVQPAR